MYIKLPNGTKYILDKSLSVEKKIEIADNLVNQWQNEINENWFSNDIKFFLDGLSNYLVWHREEEDKNKELKDVLSERKTKELRKYNKNSIAINFSDLPKDVKDALFGNEH